MKKIAEETKAKILENLYNFDEIIRFLNGEDRYLFEKFIIYFSVTDKPLLPSELKEFWESLTFTEKQSYQSYVEAEIEEML